MEHFVEILKALAWPVSVVWLGYLFRNEVRSLLNRLTALRHGDTEISFERELAKAEQKASDMDQAEVPVFDENPEVINQKEMLYRLAEISPRAAIAEAWTLIETAAVKSNLTTGIAIQRTNPRLILEYLSSSGNFSSDSIELINELRQLRNRASHLPDFAISQNDAERYLDLAIKSANTIANSVS